MTSEIACSTHAKRTIHGDVAQSRAAASAPKVEGSRPSVPTTSIPGSSFGQSTATAKASAEVGGSTPSPGTLLRAPLTAASKLYIVVLRSLSTGLKCAQACHALRAFVGEYPEIDADWYATSNNIVVLQADDLPTLADRMDALGLAVARFHEPDRGDELTALCVEPGGAHTLRRYPLAT